MLATLVKMAAVVTALTHARRASAGVWSCAWGRCFLAKTDRALTGRPLRWAPLCLFIAVVALQGGCTCITHQAPAVRDEPIACIPQHAVRPTVLPSQDVVDAAGVETAAVGAVEASFSVSSRGEAQLVLPLWTPPGRAGIEPSLSLTYSSGPLAEGPLGVGFSLRGASAITMPSLRPIRRRWRRKALPS